MGLTKPIEQDLLNFQGTFMYPKDIIRGVTYMELVNGRPENPVGRLEKEIRTYDFLDKHP